MLTRIIYVLIPIIITVSGLLIFQYSKTEKKEIVQEADYIHYLQEDNQAAVQQLEKNQARIDFWQQKLAGEPQSSLYKLQLAVILAERFKMTGEMETLKTSDTLLHSALQGPMLKKAAAYHALSSNAITRHDFQSALTYAELALQTKEAPEVSALLKYDALMELGRTEEGERTLKSITKKSTFEYLIRLSKLQDHQGNLQQAILTMENVAEWCKLVNNQTLLCWSLSNLGDMYGHAGKIRKSYETYLQVLEIDPAYHHALKGIAWIAYANDGNFQQANRIAYYLLEVKESPDMYLFLSEMNHYTGRKNLSRQYEQRFIHQASHPDYGRMYHKYLAEINLEYPGTYQMAKSYIDMEILNRPNPQSYALLAQYYHRSGQSEKSLDILQQHVEGKTYEPEVLMRIGMIYKATGSKEKAKKYLLESAEAEFELGPIAAKEISQAMAEL